MISVCDQNDFFRSGRNGDFHCVRITESESTTETLPNIPTDQGSLRHFQIEKQVTEASFFLELGYF